ncbi:MAG: GGDEF domain-containing protein [Clostridia bacterium]|nr:GGDEF domain-containing protein [Clostridia bacterium]
MELLDKNEINPGMVLEFQTLLQKGQITTLYQPIVDIGNGNILGYEALSRGPENSLLNSPLVLLSIAELLNKTWELERLLRIKALENATFTDQYLLFLNVDPNVIKDQKFKSGFTKENLRKMNISPGAIVLELTERSAINHYEDFKNVLKHYTNQGYSIAIDDAGSGYSGLKTLYEVYPKYMKIDMDFIRNINSDTFKQAIVKALIETAKIANIKTIAEGIETPEELRTLIRLGVDYGQGYYIQRPKQSIESISENVLDLIWQENNLINQVNTYSESYHYIHHVMDDVVSFDKSASCKEVYDFLNAQNGTSVCVTSGGFPLGIVTLNMINKVFGRQYGYSVYSHRPIELIMNTQPLMVDYYLPVHAVAKKALNRSNEHLYEDIIVLKGAQYAGIVTMKRILDYAINYEKNYAKELNPLTSLPGNVIINRVLQGLVKSNHNASIIYADLDNFKAYNDVYGFEKGDQVIKLTASILERCVKKHAPYTTFVGHIGGDDFIVVNNGDYEMSSLLCSEIVSAFDEEIIKYFDEKDLKNNYITTVDRFNTMRKHGITSISLGGIIGSVGKFQDVQSVSAELSLMKKEAKKIEKSHFVLNTV